jgi:hypothetical protein
MKDLGCVAADKNIEAVLHGLLSRPEALGIRAIDAQVFVHPNRDPGCFKSGPGYLRASCRGFRHALLIFDRAWEGAPTRVATDLEATVRARLSPPGWAEVVVIEPEVDIWAWSDSPHVDEILGWKGRTPKLRTWLETEGLRTPGASKPHDPKEALAHALAQVNLPRSSSVYRELANQVELTHCTDASFGRLCAILRRWFGATPSELPAP